MTRKLVVTPEEFRRELEIVHRSKLLKAAMAKQQLKHRMQDNADFQHRKQMTPDQRGRDALERLAQNIKAMNDGIAGNDTSYEQALTKARLIARRSGK